jgi:hypothetical protein
MMRERRTTIKHAKLRGEWVELCFMVRAAERGLFLSKPWGECSHYDFVVEAAGRLLRVQVKSTSVKRRNGYVCAVRNCRGEAYEKDAFDFLAAYVIPLDVWYIIPASLIAGQGSVAVYPRLTTAKYARHREAWELLGAVAGKNARSTRVGRIEACVDSGKWAVVSEQALVSAIGVSLGG